MKYPLNSEMDAKEIEQYLYKHIPITKEFGIRAAAFSADDIKFTAPLSKNINHRSTAFGGSISSLLIATCWSYLRLHFDHFKPIPQIVISKSATNFLEPVTSDFTAHMVMPNQDSVAKLMEMIDRFGKGRITLQATIQEKDQVFAAFEGEFGVIID